jgi:hypothetical protein
LGALSDPLAGSLALVRAPKATYGHRQSTLSPARFSAVRAAIVMVALGVGFLLLLGA